MPPRELDSRLVTLDSRSTLWLVITVVGSLLGFFLIFGPLAWVFGGRLRGEYKALRLRPKAAATATWLLGISMTTTAVVTVLALAWFVVVATFRW